MRVLVVEDDALYLSLTVRALESIGHTVLTARDGPAGVALAKTARPDVLVIDMRLPSMDGSMVAKEARHSLPNARIVIVSAYVPGAQARALVPACDAFVPKPYDLDALRRAISPESPAEQPTRPS